MWFKTSRLSVKTQTNVRYYQRWIRGPVVMANQVVTTLRKTCGFGLRATRKSVSQPGEALLLCRMAWWVTVLSVAARWFSLPRALAIVAGSERSTARSREGSVVNLADYAVQQRLARAIDLLLSVDVLHFKPICWKRAAVLHRYLTRNGITTRIIFGVRNEPDGKVAGHAWLEAAGEPILETTPPEYVVTYSFPSTARQSHASHPAAEPLCEPTPDLFTVALPRSERSGSCRSVVRPTESER